MDEIPILSGNGRDNDVVVGITEDGRWVLLSSGGTYYLTKEEFVRDFGRDPPPPETLMIKPNPIGP
jgi:hypothetical protein